MSSVNMELYSSTRGGSFPFRVESGTTKSGESCAVVALNVITFAAVGHGADQNGFPGAVVVTRVGLGRLFVDIPFQRHKVEHAGGEMTDDAALLEGDISGHGQRFQ